MTGSLKWGRVVTVSCGETQSSTGCLLGAFAFNKSHFLSVSQMDYTSEPGTRRCTLNIGISLKGEDFCLPALVRRCTDVESEELRGVML